MNVADEAGSTLDISGGGDLYAYRWVYGVGGTRDVLASVSSFAVVPGSQAAFAPCDSGFTNDTLSIGDSIYLGASSGLPAGTYTLLPARYALLLGAFLVTPRSGIPTGSVTVADGSSLVAGYRFNDLNATRVGQRLYASFEVAPSSVVRSRAQYDDFSADSFLEQQALAHGFGVSRRPMDAGQVVFDATRAMTVAGTLSALPSTGGRGGQVDISSPVDLVIGDARTDVAGGKLVLDSAVLSAFGAESLLIGGYRTTGANGTSVTVTTNHLVVDNAGSPLMGPDIILVANTSLTIASGAEILQTSAVSGNAVALSLGYANAPGSGDGTLLRVSSVPEAEIVRSGVGASVAATLAIGRGARISGASVILDSTYATSLDPGARLSGNSISLDSGQISLLLDNPGSLQPTAGLAISMGALQSLSSQVQSLSLLSYSTIDLYGTGRIGSLTALALHTGDIRGFNNHGGLVCFSADDIVLDNARSGSSAGPVSMPLGTLEFDASTIRLGGGALSVDQYASLVLNASGGILAQDTGGVATQGALRLCAPVLTGKSGADYRVTSGGVLTFQESVGRATPRVEGGLGARIVLGGKTVTVDGSILLPSGALTLRATHGDLSVGGRLDVGGLAKEFFDQTIYTDGGTIDLVSEAGDVTLATRGSVSVMSRPKGGNAGTLTISAPNGSFNRAGALFAEGGIGGNGGTFSLDVSVVPGGSLASLNAALNAAHFTLSRTVRLRTGNILIEGLAVAHSFNLSADGGSITVAGTIDASGPQGGSISLEAEGSVTLAYGSLLTVAAQDFNSAGKGGAVSLETRGNRGALIDIQRGSTVDLSVASANSASSANGNDTGTLHLRAPQTNDHSDLLVNSINGSIVNPSSILVEGFQEFDLAATGGVITDAVKAQVLANGRAFVGGAGTTTTGYTAMLNRILAQNALLSAVLHIEPGGEIVNRTGDITLANTWNLSTYRFGPDNNPGVLTLRSAGNLNFSFRASLSDGFEATSTALWQDPLLAGGSRSWSYRLIAGADLSASDFREVQPLQDLVGNTGSLLLGNNSPSLPIANSDSRQSIIASRYQTIRTGSGDIEIFAARDVQLLNPLATIYTAGTQAPAMVDFDPPNLLYRSNQLGAPQSPVYPSQYSMGGGNVTIFAQNDIAHYGVNDSGDGAQLVPDSSRELPNNWLYRRGYVDPATGQFAATHTGGEVESTSWWVDFSNFFEGVGALGGGNVTLIAGRNVSNVDAVLPTNARMSKGSPNAWNLRENGGGDLLVHAGNDVDGGVYYVERGRGVLSAGNSIHTNSTRAALTQAEISGLSIQGRTADATTWLPTTLFLGKGSFDVRAGGDLLLGPVANPFLLPQGINNSFYEKSYFSTYAQTDAVNVFSLTGDVILKDSANGGAGSLASWFQNVLLFYGNPNGFSRSQPWLRLAETSITPFATVTALMPGTLRVTACAGDINIVGGLTLAPSPMGTIDFAAAGSIYGLQVNGVDSVTMNREWSSSVINLSDADPSRIPGVASPLSLSGPATGFLGGVWNFTPADLLGGMNNLFSESGSIQGAQDVLQTKQALHAPGVLHANDSRPAHLYALTGDIAGFTLFSGKATKVVAGRDITDIALYVQNTKDEDVSLVSAGRDIIAYDPNSPLRMAAQRDGNILAMDGGETLPSAGDIQIGGPGALEVLAGRNLDLGVGSNRSDGTATGITSIGNARNPYLQEAGASIIAGAGIGASAGLTSSKVDFTRFISRFLNPASGGTEAARHLPELGGLLGMGEASPASVWAAFKELPTERRDLLALDLFYLVLRDAGRDYGMPSSPGYLTYTSGFAAIEALFPGNQWAGGISLTSREIKTARGGDIALFAPGGQLTIGFDISGNQPVDQGILTEAGGNISIFTRDSVTVGTSRIFTLRGGNEIIWSSLGDIAAGASSKTVQSAPPTRVLIDPQSGDVQTDLAGLATGGGIGVLATVSGLKPGDVDLVAPAGTIDAGDAGIRASGNLSVAARVVLNSDNIQVGGATVGTPKTVTPNANFGNLATASSPSAAAHAAASEQAPSPHPSHAASEEMPSIITVEVIGYGGQEGGGDAEDERK